MRDSLIREAGYLTIYPSKVVINTLEAEDPFLRDHGGLGVHHHRRVHRPVHRATIAKMRRLSGT
ncbi:MAG: hypothetical protein ACLSAH_08170 [Bilophila wadsworthia]